MNKYPAPALEKGLDILEYLSNKGVPQSQVEIAQGLNKSANEIYRMLACLEYRGYIIKSTSGKYSLSLKLYHLSHRHSPIDGLLKVAKPIMEDLANKTKQSCHMGILYSGQLMVISQVQSPGPVSLSIEEGSLFPLTKTTSGRVLLAFMETDELEKILQTNPEFNALSKKEQVNFRTNLKSIEKNGYELKKSDLTIGVTDIAVPIGHTNSGIFSVLAISSLESINQKQKTGDFLIKCLKETAISINTSIKL
ncbi:IclR family transcriptional regulator [Aquimarina sp. RZ0]|uniref:IclR family transcriptional regulator n=1 Tax=Aquimarina sp. RZ0 TaxID=2607730 RepID=UPI0011F1A904|nr:IclR family transcriptional regulator [Aquimarina sp. RZ0]KAA1246399.1 IclR family transcriptional regulator [Aquimarina sp. RZ0]